MSHLPSDSMAEESVDIPVIPEVTMSSGVELRRHSTGKVSAGNGEAKVVPHYLRASTGSCHDFCKYGRKQTFEAKERSSIPKIAVRKQLHRSSEEGIGEIMISVAKPRASVDSKPTKMSGTSHTNEQELPTDSQKQIGNKVLTSRNKTSLVKVNPSLLPNSNVSPIPRTRRQGISSTFKVETSSKSTSKKEETPLKSTSERVKTHSKSTSKKMGTSSKMSSSKGKEMELSDKHVISLNPNSIAMQTIASVKSSEDFGGQRSSEIKMEKREASCKVASPLRASVSKPSLKRIASINARKHKSLKIVSHLKNQPKPRKDEPKEHSNEVEEKTLYVIKVENESQTLQCDQNASQDVESLSHSMPPHKFTSSSTSQSSSQEGQDYATTEFEEDSSAENHESACMENGKKTLEAEGNGEPQKDGIACCEDRECQMLKVKIISRKLVETQTEKRSSPRRLTFRRGKVLWNNASNAKAEATTGPEKVVLRHHDVKGNKDGKVLLNNVIEETASKLVETQKSKVKALVGAFESIISLQERNPFANIVN